ncbi:hypothetical protein V6N13_102646 [Hibiscus sabdariffa]|uniref:Uncharacterized protein n=1 Tax=Hibiscus sabdariffa TaxID=183260 RepID=A0ABR2D4N7_9ROSI
MKPSTRSQHKTRGSFLFLTMLPGSFTGGTLKNCSLLQAASSVLAGGSDTLSSQDMGIVSRISSRKDSASEQVTQGEFESLHRDLIVLHGAWEFDPLDLGNPFPNHECFVHLWHGDQDKIVPITISRYIAERLPWIQYHEISGAGHFFPLGEGMFICSSLAYFTHKFVTHGDAFPLSYDSDIARGFVLKACSV